MFFIGQTLIKRYILIIVAAKKEKTRSKRGFHLRSLYQEHKATLRAFLVFVLCIALFFFILLSHVLDRYFVYPFTALVAQTSSVLLDLFGYQTSVAGTILKSPQASLNIGTGCNGLEAVVIFISAILAFPANLRIKTAGLLLGFVGIFIVNQTRVVGLFLVNLYAAQYLDLAHTYIGQTYVIISGVALWILWAEKVSYAGKKISAPSI